MTLFEMMNVLVDREIFAMPFDSNTITLVKYNPEETKDYLQGMVPIGQVRYDNLDNYISHPTIDLDNDTLTADDKAVLKALFNV